MKDFAGFLFYIILLIATIYFVLYIISLIYAKISYLHYTRCFLKMSQLIYDYNLENRITSCKGFPNKKQRERRCSNCVYYSTLEVDKDER